MVVVAVFLLSPWSHATLLLFGSIRESNDITKFQTSKLLPHLIKINQHPKQRRRSRAFMAFQTPKSSKQVSIYAWKENLLQISNVASFLCVIDCTILPIITLLLPLIGFAASPDQEEWLHHIGHKVAMNFVLPSKFDLTYSMIIFITSSLFW